MNKQEELKLQITEDDVNIAIRFAEEIKEFVVNLWQSSTPNF